MDNIENPQTQNAFCSVQLSKREKRIGRSILVVGLIFLIIFIGSAKATIVWGIELLRDNGSEAVAVWPFWSALTLTALLLMMPSLAVYDRWRGQVRYLGHIDIAATPADIWQKLIYHPNSSHWQDIYRQVEQLDDTGNNFRLHHYCWGDCTLCGLPKHPDTPCDTKRVNIVETHEPQCYHTKSFSENTAYELSKYKEDVYTIEALPNGNSRVTLIILMKRPKLGLIIFSKLCKPTVLALNNLKHSVEGSKNDGILYSLVRARIASAKAAPRHCGC
jgi:hypothetical protein